MTLRQGWFKAVTIYIPEDPKNGTCFSYFVSKLFLYKNPHISQSALWVQEYARGGGGFYEIYYSFSPRSALICPGLRYCLVGYRSTLHYIMHSAPAVWTSSKIFSLSLLPAPNAVRHELALEDNFVFASYFAISRFYLRPVFQCHH